MELLADLGAFLDLSWHFEAEALELSDFSKQRDELITVKDFQASVLVIQLHQLSARFQTNVRAGIAHY